MLVVITFVGWRVLTARKKASQTSRTIQKGKKKAGEHLLNQPYFFDSDYL